VVQALWKQGKITEVKKWRGATQATGGGPAGGNFVDSRCWVAWERGNK
jgi:hypothetical protein